MVAVARTVVTAAVVANVVVVITVEAAVAVVADNRWHQLASAGC